MKKILLLALFVVLFFACSNEGLDVKVTRPEGNVFCLVQEQEQNKCYDVSGDICTAIGGGQVESCPLENSSSSGGIGESSSSGEGGSSSSDGTGDSSSSGEIDSSSSGGTGDSSSSGEGGSSSSGGTEVSSSSGEGGDGDSSSSSEEVEGSSSSVGIPAPEISGTLYFKNFDYSSSSSKIYFLGVTVSASSNPDGQSKIYNGISITNAIEADCGPVSVEITGGNLTGSASSGTVNTPGEIKVKAVAMCNGAEVELASATATVVPNPTFSDCVLPSIYVYRSEPVKDLVTVENNYGRCANITYNPVNYPNSASSNAQNFSTTASCTGVTGTKACSGLNVTVANNYKKFEAQQIDYSMSSGSTVIEMPDGEELANQIGCNGGTNEENQGLINFRINKTITVQGSYWAMTEFETSAYLNNGNRILFEAIQGEIRTCKIMRP